MPGLAQAWNCQCNHSKLPNSTLCNKLIEKPQMMQYCKLIEKPQMMQYCKLIEKPQMMQYCKLIEKPQMMQYCKLIEKPQMRQYSLLIKEHIFNVSSLNKLRWRFNVIYSRESNFFHQCTWEASRGACVLAHAGPRAILCVCVYLGYKIPLLASDFTVAALPAVCSCFFCDYFEIKASAAAASD